MSNPLRYIDPTGLDSYVFYQDHDDSFVSSDRAERLAKELESLYQTPAHLVPISARSVDGVDYTGAEHFQRQWNQMGDNGKPIDGVVLYFHGQSDRLAFKDSTGEFESRLRMDEMDSLDIKSMDILTILACNAAKGESNFAREMAMRMDANYLIASDGKTTVQNLPFYSWIGTFMSPNGFQLFEKADDGTLSTKKIGALGYAGLMGLIDSAIPFYSMQKYIMNGKEKDGTECE